MSAGHPGLMVAGALLVTAVFAVQASRLEMRMTWLDMVPADEPPVKEFARIVDSFGNLSGIVIVAEGEPEGELRGIAERLAGELEKVTASVGTRGKSEPFKVIKRVDYKSDTGFIKDHLLTLTKVKDIRRMERIFRDTGLVPVLTHLNDDLESEYVESEANLLKEEDDAVRGLDGLERVLASLDHSLRIGRVDSLELASALDRFTVGDEYFMSTDRKMILLVAQPTFNSNDVARVTAGVNAVGGLLERFSERYPGFEFGMTGLHVICRDEMAAGTEDTYQNTILAFILILILFMVSFRMWSAPLLAMLVLALGITWDLGIVSIVIGHLTIMSAMCTVILIGLGVDFAIHFIGAFSELLHRGRPVGAAIEETFHQVGGGILTGALTTSVAFLMLTVSGAGFLREFGFVTGVGIMSCLAVTFLVLPPVLVLQGRLVERIRRGRGAKSVSTEFGWLGWWGGFVGRNCWIVLAIGVAATVGLGLSAARVGFNANYLEMEEKGLESVRLEDELVRRFGISPDNAIATFSDLREVEQGTDRLEEKRSVGFVESLSRYLPSREKQARRRPVIEEFLSSVSRSRPVRAVDAGALAKELERVEDNVIELSQLAYTGGLDKLFEKCNWLLGWNEEGKQVGRNRIEELIQAVRRTGSGRLLDSYRAEFSEGLKERLIRMAGTAEITRADIPEDLLARYTSSDGVLYSVVAYPRENIWRDLLRSGFLKDVKSVMPRATGTPVLMKVLVDTGKRDGGKATLLALAGIVCLLFLDFRSPVRVGLAMMPLLAATVWTLGMMNLLGWEFNFINVMATPLILGIGIDDGVHIVHRYLREGKGSMGRVLSSTGKAVLLTSLTTMLGFGSFVFARYQGYAHLGKLLFLGVGLCFIGSVTLLPAVVAAVERLGRQGLVLGKEAAGFRGRS